MMRFKEYVERKDRLEEGILDVADWIVYARKFGIDWSSIGNSNYSEAFGKILAKLVNPADVRIKDWVDDTFLRAKIDEKQKYRQQIVDYVKKALDENKPGVLGRFVSRVGLGGSNVFQTAFAEILTKLDALSTGLISGKHF